jgi:peptide/nickel transport system substrate-binding protein
MRSRMAAHARPLLAALLLLAPALIGPGGAHAQNPLVLKVGTDQKLETMNPWYAITVADYEIFQVQYELLVGFDINLDPAPGFADSWESDVGGTVHRFHIREGMKWSDGQPATCADAEYTYNLVLAAVNSEAGYIGSGYLEPYLTNAGLKSATCTDAQNLIVRTDFSTTLLTQAYVPIIPKHIWSKYTLAQIGDDTAKGFFDNKPPVVGSGPYVAVEWDPGSFIRMQRNPNYWGTPGVPDEVLFQTFSGADTMVQALKSGELDYVHQTGADAFDALKTEPNVRTSEGFANGYTMLSFNTRATQKGYHGSTSALEDQAFRDALGYAIDRQTLVQRVLSGHGVPGTTHVPPYQSNWHVEPDHPRNFSIDEANRRLDAAGYAKNANGKRLDKQGKPIVLRLTWPNSEDHSADAQFIRGWWEQLGIGVEASVTEEGALIDELYGPPAGGPANWDTYIWGWVGDPDPTSLLSLFTTDQIEAGVNDSFYSDARYDELFDLQKKELDETKRKAYIAEMQQRYYDAATYHVLYYDSVLDAQRTDKFTGWTNQPPDKGQPLFGYGYPGYMTLKDASAVPTPGPTTAASAGASGGPGASPTTTPTSSGGDSTPLLIGAAIVLIVVLGGGVWLMRRRATPTEVE